GRLGLLYAFAIVRKSWSSFSGSFQPRTAVINRSTTSSGATPLPHTSVAASHACCGHGRSSSGTPSRNDLVLEDHSFSGASITRFALGGFSSGIRPLSFARISALRRSSGDGSPSVFRLRFIVSSFQRAKPMRLYPGGELEPATVGGAL